jgi:hypothetical protein
VPPRKKTAAAPPPLTDAEVKDLAFRVKGGDSPRVIVRSASAAVPAGTRGNVIRIGNPSEGEYIVVRLGRDQVPFAPNELSLSTRGRTASSTAAAPARSATTARPAATKKTAAASSRPARASARSTTKATAKPAKSSPAKSASKSAKAAPAKAAPTRAAAPAKETARETAKDAAKAAPARSATSRRSATRSSRRGKSRSPQPLTVTMRFADSRWTIEAQRGSRRLAKAQPLRPGAVSAFAEHVDEDSVREALVETVESCRAVVEEQAAALRAELDAAEAALREYDARRR